jgi:hypothetical protein
MYDQVRKLEAESMKSIFGYWTHNLGFGELQSFDVF